MEIKFVLSNINYITIPLFTELGDGLLGRNNNWSENEIDIWIGVTNIEFFELDR